MRVRSLVLPCLLLLPACREEVILSDLPSPGGDYHAVVKDCPRRGSSFLSGDRRIEVSVLPAGRSEPCNTFIDAVFQFDAYAPVEDLELEWTSATALRAWHPGFDANSRPSAYSSAPSNPVTVTFGPAAAPRGRDPG